MRQSRIGDAPGSSVLMSSVPSLGSCSTAESSTSTCTGNVLLALLQGSVQKKKEKRGGERKKNENRDTFPLGFTNTSALLLLVFD
jgi:hypothetical protein